MENNLLRPINYKSDHNRQNLRLASMEFPSDDSGDILSLSADDNFTFVDNDEHIKGSVSYVYEHNANEDDDDDDEIPYAVPATSNNHAQKKSYPNPIVNVNLLGDSIPNNPFSLNDTENDTAVPLLTSKIPHNILQVNYSPKKNHATSFDAIKKHVGYCSYVNLNMYEGDKFVSQNMPDLYPYYSSYSASKREELVVYIWLYIIGGVYIDNNLIIRQDVITYFKNKSNVYLVTSNTSPYLLSSKFIASPPGCKFWEILFDEIKCGGSESFNFNKFLSQTEGNGSLLHRTYRKCKETISLLPPTLFKISYDGTKNDCAETYVIEPLDGYETSACFIYNPWLWLIFFVVIIVIIIAYFG